MRFKWLLVLIVSLLIVPSLAVASPLGIAGEYNEFIFGDIDLRFTDSFGGVAAGGNATLQNFSAGSNNLTPLPTGDLVVGGNLRFDEGSVGYLPQSNSGGPDAQNGTIVVGGQASFGMNGNAPNVGYGKLYENTQTIDFKAAWNHLSSVSSLWSGMVSTGTTNILKNPAGAVYQVELLGKNDTLNVFDLGALTHAGTTDLRDLGFYLDVPATATTLINVPGQIAAFESFGFYYFDETTGKYIKGSEDSLGLFPDSKILYNFYEADALTMAMIEMHGSVLAPNAAVNFYNGHIEGNLIAWSLTGDNTGGYFGGEAHDELFNGEIPVPEPATYLLVGCGLLIMALVRGRRSSPETG